MKRLLSICATVIVVGSLMSGCSATKDAFQKANGVILYGNQQQISDTLNQDKKDIKEKDEYTIKVAEDGKQDMMILDKTTAKALVEKKLLKEVTKDNDTEAITSLPKVTKDTNALFAKQEVKEMNLAGQNSKIIYGGNKIIGDGRSYVDEFLIVDDSQFTAIKGTEKKMAVIKYDKNPDKKLSEFNVDEVQLVKVGK
ncbi:lipoprotein BA_5634 family protein [Priestia filamentosa]|uniref:lipoprotein BA_5634 family protein n=1 Tax=Priestia filamentosa TaxID=1402861 RepID=UPI00234B3C74|nr:lipoprotein BA_5634 family protein [Priestia filamentosa]WCM17223.1 lipoprotein BA_5634 family protein [Priestia filamentosa]